MWNVITGNHVPTRFRALATLDKRCVVATRCVGADFDGSLDLNFCVCEGERGNRHQGCGVGTWGGRGLGYMPVSMATTTVPMGETPQVGAYAGRSCVNAFG